MMAQVKNPLGPPTHIFREGKGEGERIFNSSQIDELLNEY